MLSRTIGAAAAVLLSSTLPGLYPQQTQPSPTVATVPRLVRIASVFRPASGQPVPVESVTLSIYKDNHDPAPLWQETQNVALDAEGRYTVLMGASLAEGMPLELFSAGEPRWLGVQFNRPGEIEQPRVLLVSVPYALKAADADTLGGKPASAYVLSPPETARGDKGDTSTSQTTAPTGTRGKKLSAGPDSVNSLSGSFNEVDVQFNDTSGTLTGYSVQNLGSGAASYSGMLFYDQNGALGQFQGFNNSTHEYRINNIASGGSINFMIGSSSKFLVGNNGNIGIGESGTARLSVKANPSFTATGTVSITTSSTTVTGVGTKFLTELSVGDRVQFVQTGDIKPVTAIASDTSLTVSSSPSSNVSGSGMTILPAMFRIHDSSGATRFQVNDIGSVAIGGGHTTSSLKLWVTDGNRFSGTSTGASISNGNVTITSTTAQAADVGGILALGGSRGPTGIFSFAGLRGGKENGTADDSAGYLGLYTVDGSSTFAERMRLTSAGRVGIGTTSPGRELEVAGGVRLNTLALKPACDATVRGTFWVTQGGGGVKDSVEVCAKDAADAYAWRTLY